MKNLLASSGRAYRLLCVCILALMVLIVTTNTFLRYVFHSGIIQAEEILRYLFIWLSFLGIMSVYNKHEHIAVTVVTERLSPKVATIMSLIVQVISLAAFAFLIKGSVEYFIESETAYGQLTRLPYRVIVTAIVIASIVCFLLTVRDTVVTVKRLASPAKGE